jgi:UDP-N-acetylmuramoyl-tripeptide--D-alanyl-D-alanine ligase
MKTEQIYRIFREESKGISIDSRTVTEGQIFFALCGQNHNGNRYAGDALAKGASWAVIDDPVYSVEKTILVDNCLSELQALASYHRKIINAKVLAITGTNGKTTTKELISAVLARKFKVHHTKGNLNNEIGVPLTILSAPLSTQILVIEMGANHIGEIKALCNIAMPDYGMITNVGTAHIEGFGSPEGVVKAKTELYEYLEKTNGVAFYNDNDIVLSGKISITGIRSVPFSNPAGY